MTTAGATIMAAGLAAILYGVLRDDLARSLGGACLAMTALMPMALIAIRRWITDTSAERAHLADALRQAQDERTRYIAAQAALENEQGRLHRDLAADRARTAAMLIAERDGMQDEFEEQRAQLISETFEVAVDMERRGLLKPTDPSKGNLIRFPGQTLGRAPEHEAAGPGTQAYRGTKA
ncbi:hypothetical protein RB200_19815 [Streptomyces sp. PmtG]